MNRRRRDLCLYGHVREFTMRLSMLPIFPLEHCRDQNGALAAFKRIQ